MDKKNFVLTEKTPVTGMDVPGTATRSMGRDERHGAQGGRDESRGRDEGRDERHGAQGGRDGRVCVMEWTVPMYHKGRENYVDFYAVDPATGRMRRKKVMVDHIKIVRVRNAYARALVEELTQKLMRGWNPFVEQRSGAQFTRWEVVVTRYRQYVMKMHGERSFREETMRDYLSRLKVLDEWLPTSGYKVFFPYQADGVVMSAFMDYVLIDRNCSPQTYNNYLVWLRGFFGWLKVRRYIHDDPTDGLPSLRVSKRKNRTVIPDGVLVRVRELLSREHPHFLLACSILYYLFVRPHEMSFLRIRDFNIERKTLVLHGDQTKNGQSAVVTLPDHVVRLMVELGVFRHPGEWYLFGNGCRPGAEWRDSKQFRDYWDRHVRRALGLPSEYKFYSLKDTGITGMLRANTDPLSVRDQARHSSLLITNTYTPLDIQEANPLILGFRGVL